MPDSELLSAQRVLVSKLGALVNSEGWKEFARLVEDGRKGRVASLIGSQHDYVTHRLQGEIQAIDWLLSLPKKQFDILEQMAKAEAEATEGEQA